MATSLESTPPETEITFARDLGLFDATMIGIGAMIGAGIFVLTGIAAGEAGPAALPAFAFNGLVTLLTALAYAELASVYPTSGGGYSSILKKFPGRAGSASSWMLWFCYIIALRRNFPEMKSGFRVPLYPATPIAAIVLNKKKSLFRMTIHY